LTGPLRKVGGGGVGERVQCLSPRERRKETIPSTDFTEAEVQREVERSEKPPEDSKKKVLLGKGTLVD